MIDTSKIDYSFLDRPEILMFLFHPRPEWGGPRSPEAFQELEIPVEEDVIIGGRFYPAHKEAPTILFFHGNGEIVADYEDIAPMYTERGINFLPVDYRGYGRSTGRPTITAMMRDCHWIFEYVQGWLRDGGYRGPFIVMGRSLGSASALELVSCYEARLHGLIIESGFAYASPLLRLLGVDLEGLGITEEKGFRNIDKIRTFPKPTLIIHAEHDHIIPLSDGQTLYEACPAQEKRLLVIPRANHNNIFARGIVPYMEAVQDLADKVRTQARPD